MNTGNWWTASERAIVLAHYGPDAPDRWPMARLLAALPGRGRNAIKEAAARFGVARFGRQRTYADLAIRRAYEWGLSDSELARRAGVSTCTVRRWRRRHEMPLCPATAKHRRKGA